MNFLTFILLFFFLNGAKSQYHRIVDTIYIECPQEKLNFKYHSISPQKDSFNTVFSFNVNWNLHGHKKETIEFPFNSLSMQYKPASNWFVPMVDTNTIKQYKNLYTLKQFTKELEKESFFLPIFHKKVQLVMLYGAASLSKVEVYPVEVSTYLASH